MGADFLTIGYTERLQGKPKAEEAKTIIASYREQLLENIDKIDYMGAVEATIDDFDEVPSDEEYKKAEGDALLSYLEGGWDAFWENRQSATYTIPGHEDRLFTVAGGSTWGDDPFDGFTGLCLLVEACAALPELGEKIGLLGGGIVLN